MDRPLSDSIQRGQRYRQVIWYALIPVVLGVLFFVLRKQLTTSISSNRIRTATAEVGRVESTLNASGEVIPAFEQILTSPISASVQEVKVPVGTNLAAQQIILLLDKSRIELEYKKLEDELALKKNQIKKLRFSLDQDLFDLEINDSIKSLNIARLEAERDNAKRLLEVGGGVQENVDQANLRLRIAQLEKRQLEHQLKIQRQSTETEIEEQAIQLRIKGHQLTELERKLDQAEIRANRPGVLTWVQDEIGSNVSEGETIARVADLQSFKVEGTISDLYAEKLKPGLRTLVLINEERLDGVITSIRPTVENNIIRFDVQLDEPNHPALRPNMRVEVFVVLSYREKAIRVASGPTFKGAPKQFIFIKEGDRAIRREVELGLSNLDYVEVTSNLFEGEEVILSDLSSYDYLKEIQIK